MYKFKILVEGYAHPGENGKYHASPTTSLVYDDNVTILVDPGTNSKLLTEALDKEGIKCEDIKHIFLSHYHPDHFLNLKLFPYAVLYDGSMIWDGDEEIQYTGTLPNTEIEVVATPGHTMEQASLFFNTQEFGLVGLCQDVFWWEDGKQDNSSFEVLMENIDPFMADLEALKASRRLVLDRADWIVPGHGKMFKNPTKDIK